MNKQSTPWYRQLWPWLLIAPPVVSIIGGFAILWVAISSNDGLVTPEHALAINRSLTREEAANCAARDRACLNTPVEEAR